MDVKPDWNAIAKVGIPGVIAIFLVWRLSEGFDVFSVRIAALESKVQTDHARIAAHSDRMEDLTGRAYMLNEKILRVMQIMCANEAKSPEARRLCLSE